MRRLLAVPVVAPFDRLYVSMSDDTLKIDQCHAYTGCAGRTLVGSLWSSTHNRAAVLAAIQRLVQETQILVESCIARLDAPYVLKNLECFSTESGGTRHCRNCLSTIEKSIPELRNLISSLQQTYEGDTTTESTLSESINTVKEITRTLQPVRYLLF